MHSDEVLLVYLCRRHYLSYRTFHVKSETVFYMEIIARPDRRIVRHKINVNSGVAPLSRE